ncbi:MAG: universal stress protein [Candidatus Dormibacteraceae bacterium]
MDISGRFERVLLATDGSEESRAAVDATIAVARSPMAKVRVAQVWNLEVRHRHGQLDGEVHGEAGRMVETTVDQLFRAGVIAERDILRSDGAHVAAAIACAARAFDADLVVIGSRGLSDWQALTVQSGNIQMVCGLDCPVLIVRAPVDGRSMGKWKVLLAVAAGDYLEPGVRAAVSLARADTAVIVVQVAQTMSGLQRFAYVESGHEIRGTMAEACQLFADARLQVQDVVAQAGPVTRAVAAIARDANADLMVIGSSRMGDMGGLFLGSVSHDLLHATDRPVLVAGRAQ